MRRRKLQRDRGKAKKRYLEDDTTDDFECEHLREEFLLLKEEYQVMHGKRRFPRGNWRGNQSYPKTFFMVTWT
jgi:hypothetical protein